MKDEEEDMVYCLVAEHTKSCVIKKNDFVSSHQEASKRKRLWRVMLKARNSVVSRRACTSGRFVLGGSNLLASYCCNNQYDSSIPSCEIEKVF